MTVSKKSVASSTCKLDKKTALAVAKQIFSLSAPPSPKDEANTVGKLVCEAYRAAYNRTSSVVEKQWMVAVQNFEQTGNSAPKLISELKSLWTDAADVNTAERVTRLRSALDEMYTAWSACRTLMVVLESHLKNGKGRRVKFELPANLTVEQLADDIFKLNNEFTNCKYNYRTKVLSVMTEPISLTYDGITIPFGSFSIRICLSSTYTGTGYHMLKPPTVHAGENNRRAVGDGNIHPHVATSHSVCLGDGEDQVYACLRNGDVHTALVLVDAVLHEYAAGQAFVEMDAWLDDMQSCAIDSCNRLTATNDAAARTCPECKSIFCGECATESLATCDDTGCEKLVCEMCATCCSQCQSTHLCCAKEHYCRYCEEIVCSNPTCSYRCVTCRKLCCSRCAAEDDHDPVMCPGCNNTICASRSCSSACRSCHIKFCKQGDCLVEDLCAKCRAAAK